MPFQYHGGPVLSHVEVVPIYVSINLSSWAADRWLECEDQQTLRTLVESPLLDSFGYQLQLNIGRGKVVPPIRWQVGIQLDGGNRLLDKDAQDLFEFGFAVGVIPTPKSDTCYFLFLPPDVLAVEPPPTPSAYPRDSDHGIDAYHSHFYSTHGSVSYAVIPRHKPGSTISHELFEMVSDPVPPSGYVNWDNGAECADRCLGTFTFRNVDVTEFSSYLANGACVSLSDDHAQVHDLLRIVGANTCFGSVTVSSALTYSLSAVRDGAPLSVHDLLWNLGGTDDATYSELIALSPVRFPVRAPTVQIYTPSWPVTFRIEVSGTDDDGCSVGATRDIQTISADQAASEEAACERLPLLIKLIHEEHINLLWNPLWDPLRDFNIRPVEMGDIRGLRDFADRLRELEGMLSPVLRQSSSADGP